MLENVCLECNNKMERYFEKTVSEMLLVKLIKQKYGIDGRGKNAPSPWINQKVETDDGFQVILSEDATPKTTSPPSISIDEIGNLNIRAVEESKTDPESQAKRLYGAIPKDIIRQYTLQKRQTIQKIADQLRACKPTLVSNVNIGIDYTAVQKLFIKVAFETAAVLFGWDWVCYSTQAKRLHDILLCDCGGTFDDIDFTSTGTEQCKLLHAAFPVPGNPQKMFVQLLGIPASVYVMENEYLQRMRCHPLGLFFTGICLDGTIIPIPGRQQVCVNDFEIEA
jgi:hypothetical protein